LTLQSEEPSLSGYEASAGGTLDYCVMPLPARFSAADVHLLCMLAAADLAAFIWIGLFPMASSHGSSTSIA
jgi:hypothetical protein